MLYYNVCRNSNLWTMLFHNFLKIYILNECSVHKYFLNYNSELFAPFANASIYLLWHKEWANELLCPVENV